MLTPRGKLEFFRIVLGIRRGMDNREEQTGVRGRGVDGGVDGLKGFKLVEGGYSGRHRF